MFYSRRLHLSCSNFAKDTYSIIDCNFKDQNCELCLKFEDSLCSCLNYSTTSVCRCYLFDCFIANTIALNQQHRLQRLKYGFTLSSTNFDSNVIYLQSTKFRQPTIITVTNLYYRKLA
jgi:hypothetical protein